VTIQHPARVAIKVYERGVGWTQACGTGSVATVAVLHSLGTIQHPARVAKKVYERGVGWTQACGTGSVATAAVLHSLGLTGPRAAVENPGGELIVSLDGSQATLGGPVTFEGDMEWTL